MCVCDTLFSCVVDIAGAMILRGRDRSREMANEESKCCVQGTQLLKIRIKTENVLSPGSGSFCYTIPVKSAFVVHYFTKSIIITKFLECLQSKDCSSQVSSILCVPHAHHHL